MSKNITGSLEDALKALDGHLIKQRKASKLAASAVKARVCAYIAQQYGFDLKKSDITLLHYETTAVGASGAERASFMFDAGGVAFSGTHRANVYHPGLFAARSEVVVFVYKAREVVSDTLEMRKHLITQ